MKSYLERFLLSLLFILLANPQAALGAGSGSRNEKSNYDWTPVMDAIIEVESNGNRHAKNGDQVGAMQITPILVADCNDILKQRKSAKRFKLSDRLSVDKSKEMFLLIQSRYNPTNNVEKAIRLWNGGVNYNVKRTQRYYEKVMRALRK
ncbi:MAG: lytic transglycosylase domain-containing protein [Prevotella sp.]|nr:lytic transglycosylase domain-containing protein [Prevotella sp.]